MAVYRQTVGELSQSLQGVNAAIRVVKEQTATGNLAALTVDIARLKAGRQPGQRPKADRLAPKVLALVAEGRSYRLIGRELGLTRTP